MENIKIFSLTKDIFKNINNNKYMYIINTLILQFLIIDIAMLFLEMAFKLLLFFSNQNNISKDNILDILLNPFGLLGILIYILTLIFFMFIEFSYLTSMVLGLKKIEIKKNFYKIKNMLGINLFLLLLYFLSLIPFASVGINSLITENIYIPKFITGEFLKSPKGIILIVLLSIFLLIIDIFLIFTLPLTIMREDSVLNNMKKSIKLVKKYGFKMFLVFINFEIIMMLISFLILFSIYFIIILFKLENNIFINTLMLTLIKFLIFMLAAFTKIYAILIIVEVIKKERIIENNTGNLNNKQNKFFKFLTYSFVFFYFLFSFIISYYSLESNDFNENIQVIAHRGYTKNAVENTLTSIENAIKNDAKLIEIDILLTKDNKFVVIHDNNLKRLANLDNKISDMNLEDILKLEISQGEYTDRIPTLEKAVKLAKDNNVKLLVELKPHGFESKEYIDLIIQEFNRLDINDFPVMSIDLKTITQLEEKAKYLKTGLVIPINFGIFNDSNVDFLVVEDFSYSYSINPDNKEMFVWTINDSPLIRKYLQSEVAGIISDELEKIEEIKKELKNNNTYFDKLQRIIIGSN